MSASDSLRLDLRSSEIGDLAQGLRRLIARSFLYLVIILGIAVAYVQFSGQVGALCLGEICLGTCIALSVWRTNGRGLPIMPMVAIQHLVVYGLPIVVNEPTIAAYPESMVNKAGLEVLVFLVALAGTWRFGLHAGRIRPAISYTLSELNRGGLRQLMRLGFTLTAIATGYLAAERTGVLDFILGMLPGGSQSIVWALVSAVSMCGFFILSLVAGAGELRGGMRLAFWLLLAFNCYISASSFLLSAAAVLVISVAAGLFWSAGRIPWAYLAVVLSVLSFLNISKVEMRLRYWGAGGADEIPEFTLDEMPARYAEWIGVSFDMLTAPDTRLSSNQGRALVSASGAPIEKGQSLLDRVNNLQNLLFVIEAVDNEHVPVLEGETYTLIPKLLIPRVLWPGKPRSHEGQVILNVHFMRQDLHSTTTTYIAWGLLPEAYGNFGTVAGSIILGAVLGLFCAWVENITARKPVISMEGFVAFALFIGLANSFEMVASVMVTSIFQSLVPIAIASYPFVHRQVGRPILTTQE